MSQFKLLLIEISNGDNLPAVEDAVGTLEKAVLAAGATMSFEYDYRAPAESETVMVKHISDFAQFTWPQPHVDNEDGA